MGGSKKSKRVIWPSDDNLCQVKLFLSEDNPAQVGSGAQDHLQPKAWQSHSNFSLNDDSLPPGFEGGPHQPTSIPWNQLSQIPAIKWHRAAAFKMDESWRVTAGEESVEVHIESDRINRVLEAIYPRESAIPPNPVVAPDVENSPASGKPPLSIPLTPIEDEDAATAEFTEPAAVKVVVPTAQTTGTYASSSHNGPPPVPTAPGVDPAVLAAASAALSAVMDQGNLIDPELLIKILGDPKMIEQLVRNHGPSMAPQLSPATQFNPAHNFPAPTQNMPMPGRVPNPLPNPVARPSAQVNRAEFVAAPMTTASKGVFYPPQGPMGLGPNSRPPPPIPDIRPPNSRPPPPIPDIRPPNSRPPPPVSDIRPDTILPGPSLPVRKDINYYKSLIQQHGNDFHEAPPQYASGNGGGGGRTNHHGYPGGREPSTNGRPRDWKPHPRMMKPCLYYNTEKGCRNGASCNFQHDDKPVQRGRVDSQSQSSKRMKMDREITGT